MTQNNPSFAQQQGRTLQQQTTQPVTGGPLPARSNDNPQTNAEQVQKADYTNDPMQPSPTLLRKIASTVTGGESDEAVTNWATAFNEHYPA